MEIFSKIKNKLECETDPVGFRFCSILFHALCLFPNFCSHLISSLLLPFILVPCLVFSLRSTFLSSTGLGPTKMRGASWWEKGIARAIELGTSHYFVPCDSLFSRLNVGAPFSIELNFDACVFICCSCIEFPLFPDFQFPTWARFRRVSAHLDVFSIQELRHFADFLSLACFSFP